MGIDITIVAKPTDGVSWRIIGGIDGVDGVSPQGWHVYAEPGRQACIRNTDARDAMVIELKAPGRTVRPMEIVMRLAQAAADRFGMPVTVYDETRGQWQKVVEPSCPPVVGITAPVVQMTTDELAAGDIVHIHGGRVQLEGTPRSWDGYGATNGTTVYKWERMPIISGQVGDYRNTTVWTVQGNEFAHWWVERPANARG